MFEQCVVLKYSYFPYFPMEGIFAKDPLEFLIMVYTFLKMFWSYRPRPPRKFQSLLWGLGVGGGLWIFSGNAQCVKYANERLIHSTQY